MDARRLATCYSRPPTYRHGHDEVGIGCLVQLMVGGHMSITGHSDQDIAGSSIMHDNLPPCIQLGTDMSEKSPSLTNYMTMRIKTGFGWNVTHFKIE